MGLCGLSQRQLVAVFLLWPLLMLGLVRCEWTHITQEEADRIWSRPGLTIPPVKPVSKAQKHPIDEPKEQIDISFSKSDGIDKSIYKGESRTDTKSSDKKGETSNNTMPSFVNVEAGIDSDLTPQFLGPDEAPSDDDLYEYPDEEVYLEEESDNPTGFEFECTNDAFKIALFEKEMDRLQVFHLNRVVNVKESPKSCGYVNKKTGLFIVPFDGCFTKKNMTQYSVALLAGGTHVLRATCLAPGVAQSKSMPRSGVIPATLGCQFITTRRPSTTSTVTQTPPPSTTRTFTPTVTQSLPSPGPMSQSTIPPAAPPQSRSCPSNLKERVQCSFEGCSEAGCLSEGCCWDPYAPAAKRCFYPENECTKDGHFMFTIRHDSATPYMLDPYSLEIPGSNCGPVVVTPHFAVFKFGLDECGTIQYSLGGTAVTLAEVQTAVEILTLKYAVISRSTQIRFLIECRHSSGSNAVASAAYMVMTSPSPVPSAVFFDGLYGIVLCIAKDETYTDFYETYHPPLSMVLNERIYLQLELMSPFPEATIVVNYCIAYPRYYNMTTMFIYEGCPNKNDPGTGIIHTIDFNGEKNKRRIWIDTFQFRDADKYIDEDIYFMCNSRVCFNEIEPCPQQCFDA